jgi:hypothetical protein
MSKRNLISLTLVLLTVEWIFFKMGYPFPDLMGDSYVYLSAAMYHRDINIWPIGYSKFLWLFHSASHSATSLVSFQFFALELALLYFYCSIKNWFRFRRETAIFLYVICFCNPLCFYLSNLVASDSFFAVLTILWFTELLRLFFDTPSFWHLWLQALYIGLAYTFRYTAMYYPVITAVALILSNGKIAYKVLGSLMFIVFLAPFIIFSRNAGRKLTGVPIYSILSGWQWGNNAMEMRGKIKVDETKLPSPSCLELDRIGQAFFKKNGPGFETFLDTYERNYFIVEEGGPLRSYMLRKYGDQSIKSWALAGVDFAEYGKYMLRTYPMPYCKYHILPNVKFYFLPPLQDLEVYNMGSDTVENDMRQWFGYPSVRIAVISKTIQAKILAIFPIAFLFLNFFFPSLCVVYAILCWNRRRRIGAPFADMGNFNKSCLLVWSYFLINALFSIVANRACLRYEFFPMAILLTFCMLLGERISVEGVSMA